VDLLIRTVSRPANLFIHAPTVYTIAEWWLSDKQWTHTAEGESRLSFSVQNWWNVYWRRRPLLNISVNSVSEILQLLQLLLSAYCSSWHRRMTARQTDRRRCRWVGCSYEPKPPAWVPHRSDLTRSHCRVEPVKRNMTTTMRSRRRHRFFFAVVAAASPSRPGLAAECRGGRIGRPAIRHRHRANAAAWYSDSRPHRMFSSAVSHKVSARLRAIAVYIVSRSVTFTMENDNILQQLSTGPEMLPYKR